MSKQYKVSDFFKTDLPSYAAYDNSRKIASYIDGLKISMRKIIYTLYKKYPGKEKTKTETVANVCAAFTNYLHGAANLGGVCDTMAQSFIGANNYPLLSGNSGGFGTRINPMCAANRYTKVSLSDILKSLLEENDLEIAGRQFFEGSYIEPQFFIPIFPVLLLNGSEGLSTGFSQKIFPRNPEDVMSYIKKRLGGTERPRMDILPWFKGHLGKVQKNHETNITESFGVITKNNMTSYTITELPIGMDYQKYIEILDKLCENNIIVDYDNYSSTKDDTIKFEIKTTREFTKKHDGDERKLYEDFKLIKSLPEVYNCIDENNRIKEFNNVESILDAFIDIRLKFYNKRKQYILDTLKRSLGILASKYIFVKSIIDGSIVVNKKKKDEIIKQLEKIEKIQKVDDKYDYLLNMPIHSLTSEKLEELKKLILEKKEEYKKVSATTIQDMWLTDLKEFKKAI